MSSTIKERMNSYKESCSMKLMRRLPVIININGRSFSKITNTVSKPYSEALMEAMCATTIKLCHEIDGTVLAYTYSDDITIIARNDQTNETQPWFQNEIQKIASVSSSIATSEFSHIIKDLGITLNGDARFSSTVFTVPSISEVVNLMIHKQQMATASALSYSLFYELVNEHGEEDAIDILKGRSSEDKEELLREYGKSLSDYPLTFRRGAACYRSPQIVPTRDGSIIKKKWIVNTELPVFSANHTFLNNVLNNGTDIIRAPT